MTGSWPVELAQAVHTTLLRRCPPPRHGAELEPLCCDLIRALEAGELTLDLPADQHTLLLESGWLEQETCPLHLSGNRVGWRRWVEAMEEVIDTLVLRSALQPPSIGKPSAAPPALPAHLNTEQQQAALALDSVSVLLISGGPGTGKTSTVVEVLQRALHRTPTLRIGLAAPTGKAARRLGEAVRPQLHDLHCFTLHRWLEAGRHGFGRHRERPLELDLLVIDEMSMVDLALMQALIAALPSSCRLVLVGDPAQLPPIGSGAVWNDLQAEGVRQRFGAGAVTLQTTYRNRGAIAALASALRDRHQPEIEPLLEGISDDGNVRHHSATLRRLPSLVVRWWTQHRHTLEQQASQVLDANGGICADAAEALLNTVEQELVLCPRRRGPWSLEDVHRTLLGNNRHDPNQWPDGLPVISGANQAELGLANGDLGVKLSSAKGTRLLFRVLHADGSSSLRLLHPSRLQAVEPAVAITIHRAQGSEADHVIVLWPPSQDSDKARPLDQRLLYTAVTRARVSLELVTSTPSSHAG
ncbi:MAG: ATP-dependent DNA helicase [Synechococcus sp.]